MKKFLLTIAFVSALSSVSAQTETTATEETVDSGYNRWSVELNAGVNKPQRPLTLGYYTATPSFYNADFGVRYMFNNKFGLKADIGYYSFQNKDGNLFEFSSKYYRADLQAVLNLGRIMEFESWTKRIGLLTHIGAGWAQLKSDDHNFTDRMGNFIVGFTAQVKVSDRIAITGDFTSITNVRQEWTFDGNNKVDLNSRGVGGGIFQGTFGVNIYLGSHQTHADWYFEGDKNKEELENLQKRLGELETMMNDTDKDGVPDYLDAEPNSMTGVAVDSKGRTVDQNNNGVPDELESYMQKTYGDNMTKTSIANTPSNNELVKALINDGYVTTYFDFNKTTPTNVSTEGIDFILTYLRNNPGASVDIIGHADEIGRSAYNDKLSNARANNVKNTLVNAKIDPARLNVVPAGEDASVNKESAGARKLVRRVTFRVK
jgi:OmpA-OmpF porin, OOP family